MKAQDILLYLSIKHEGRWDNIYQDILKKAEIDNTELQDVIESYRLKHPDCQYLTLLDNNFPAAIKQIYRPPFTLFYRGDVKLINPEESKPAVAMLVEKTPYYYKNKAYKLLLESIPESYNLLFTYRPASSNSPLVELITQALQLGKHKIILVLDCGFETLSEFPWDKVTKQILKQGGLIITSIPDNVVRSTDSIPEKYNLGAGIIKSVIVIEALTTGGNTMFISQALSLSKDIYVLPIPLFENKGTEKLVNNTLISEGAAIYVEDALN